MTITISSSAERVTVPAVELSYNVLMQDIFSSNRVKTRAGKDAGADGEGDDQHADADIAIEESRPELKNPPLFKVILLNDD